MMKLREVSNTLITFTDVDECISFITNNKAKEIFLVISDVLGQTVVPIIHDMTQINTIYIFSENNTPYKQWIQQWSKITGVFTDIKSICEVLKKAVQQFHQNSILMSFVTTNNDTTNTNLDELDQSFMYTLILKEILLTIDFEPQHFEEFIAYCREQFNDDTKELDNVNRFEKEYRQHTPIWWYTYQSFLYSMLNYALRTMEVDIIIMLGFFIGDPHKQITQLHSEQQTKYEHSKSLVVYRGQGLCETDLKRLMKTQGGLLSFNNFLLTSLDRNDSLAFAENSQHNPSLTGVLFQITIDSSISSTPFANLHTISHYEMEVEVLFSMHSIFRIGQMKSIDETNRLWEVDLTLTGDNDPQLHALAEHIREETFPHMGGWYRLGELLMELGQFLKAQQVYDVLLDRT